MTNSTVRLAPTATITAAEAEFIHASMFTGAGNAITRTTDDGDTVALILCTDTDAVQWRRAGFDAIRTGLYVAREVGRTMAADRFETFADAYAAFTS